MLRENPGNAREDVNSLRENVGNTQSVAGKFPGMLRQVEDQFPERGRPACGKVLGLLVCRPIAGKNVVVVQRMLRENSGNAPEDVGHLRESFWECSYRLKTNVRQGGNHRVGKFW